MHAWVMPRVYKEKNFNALALAWSAKTRLGDAGNTVEYPLQSREQT